MVEQARQSLLQRALTACVLLFLGTVCTLFVAGLFLPDHIEVQRVIELDASKERVHPLLVDLERWREWTAWGAQDETLVHEYSDPSDGVGAWYIWRGEASAAGRIELTAADPERGVWYDMTFDIDPDAMKGALRYLPSERGVQLEWSLRGELNGPLERSLGPILAWRIGSDFDDNLASLAARLTEAD